MSCAVYFNLDDTLTQMTQSFEEIYAGAIQEAGLNELEGMYEQYTKLFFNRFNDKWATPRRQAIDQLAKKHECYDAEKVESFADAWDELESDAVQLKDGVKEVLQELADQYPLGILTNGTGRLQRMKLQKLGIDDLFDTVVVSGEVGYQKPEKQIFAYAKQELEADTHVIISHLARRDVLAGKKTGFEPIWVTDSEKELPEKVGRKIKRLEELPTVLDEFCE